MIRKLRNFVGGLYRQRRWSSIYRRFKGFTMIPEPGFVANLALAFTTKITATEGCIVECGVWRGGMSAGIASVMGPTRTYYLFDSFEGLPPAQKIDGESALKWEKDTESPTYYNNCAAPIEFAREAMTKSGATNFKLIQGWFNDTVPPYRVGEPIAILRLDGDWYESTMVCLENLFDRVVPNGLIILDDYIYWDGCSRAVHDFLSRRSATERIHFFQDVCYLVKSPSSTQPKDHPA